MILIIFFLSYDSLPPLPDFSQIIFPEPLLWIDQAENSLLVSGYAGNFYGGKTKISVQRLNITGFFERMINWDTLKTAAVEAFYSIPLPHLWIRAKLWGSFLERDNKYTILSPQFDFSSTLPWAVIFGSLETDLWYINNKYYNEEKMESEIIFDRTRYLPHFKITSIYTDNQLKPMFIGKLHLRNFHLELGSPIFYSFPSPHFIIQYSNPRLKFETAVKCGIIYSTLKEYFDPEIPLKYKIPVGGESLKVGLNLNVTIDFAKHYCGFFSAYKNWNCRLVPEENFVIGKACDIQEINIYFLLRNKLINNELLNITHTLHLHYNWSDTTIVFLSPYSIVDTLDVHLNPLQISAETKYLSKRDGLHRELSPVVTLSPTIGLKYKFWKIFLRIFNITNERKQIYDNYLLKERQYAGGIVFSTKF